LLVLRELDRGKLMLFGFMACFWALGALTTFDARYYLPLLPVLLILPLFFLLSDIVPDIRLPSQVSLKLCLLLFALTWVGVDAFQRTDAAAAYTEAAFVPQVEA